MAHFKATGNIGKLFVGDTSGNDQLGSLKNELNVCFAAAETDIQKHIKEFDDLKASCLAAQRFDQLDPIGERGKDIMKTITRDGPVKAFNYKLTAVKREIVATTRETKTARDRKAAPVATTTPAPPLYDAACKTAVKCDMKEPHSIFEAKGGMSLAIVAASAGSCCDVTRRRYSESFFKDICLKVI